ncbi:hypothetical protein [Methanobrevibacter sp.]
MGRRTLRVKYSMAINLIEAIVDLFLPAALRTMTDTVRNADIPMLIRDG